MREEDNLPIQRKSTGRTAGSHHLIADYSCRVFAYLAGFFVMLVQLLAVTGIYQPNRGQGPLLQGGNTARIKGWGEGI